MAELCQLVPEPPRRPLDTVHEPVFFVVERRAGREEAAIYHDQLPVRLTRKGSSPIVYALRLDKLPDGERWAKLPIGRLYAQYIALRDAGKLPPADSLRIAS